VLLLLPPSLAFFSQYKLSPPSLRLSIDYRAFTAHPDTATTQPHVAPREDAYGWQLLPREIRGLLRSLPTRATLRDIVNFTYASREAIVFV